PFPYTPPFRSKSLLRMSHLCPTMVLVWVVAAVVTVVSACGAQTSAVKRPFVVDSSVEDGPGSGLWGDGSSGPGGMHIGCIRERRFAVLITVRNRTHRKVTLL